MRSYIFIKTRTISTRKTIFSAGFRDGNNNNNKNIWYPEKLSHRYR